MAANFGVFLEKILLLGLEYYGKYYGFYRATVTRNDDPEKRGRILARAPGVGHDIAPNIWIDPAFPFAGGDHGTFWPPEVGDSVRVAFENGNPGEPVIYLGGWFGKDEPPVEVSYTEADGRPERRGFVTRAGHTFVFNDEPGSERVRMTWHKPADDDPALTDVTLSADRTTGDFAFMSFEPDGSAQIANKNGSLINMDATNGLISIVDENGNSITLDSAGAQVVDNAGNLIAIQGGNVTVIAKEVVHLTAKTTNIRSGSVFLGDGANKSVVLGEDLIAYLTSHFHSTGVGPSGPPVTPPTPALLSKSVKTKT